MTKSTRRATPSPEGAADRPSAQDSGGAAATQQAARQATQQAAQHHRVLGVDLGPLESEPAERGRGLSFPFQAPRPAQELVDVAPGVKWLRLPMPFTLDHVNVYLLKAPEGWLLIDTGLDSPDSRRIWQELLSGPLQGERIQGIVCTHYHVDHAGLAGLLSERLRVPVHMSYQEYFTLRGWPMDLKEVHWQHARFYQKAGLPEELVPGTLVNFDFSQETSEPPPSFLCLRDGRSFPPAGGDWRIMTGGGHSPEHALLYSEREKLLFSGDQLLPRISSNVSVNVVHPQDEPLSLWLASLDRLAGLSDEVLVLPGHGLPFRGARARVAELRRHHEQKFQMILTACSEWPLTAYQLVQILYPRTLAPFDLLLALGECQAHLNFLLEHGRIGETTLARGAVGYQSAPRLRQSERPTP